MSDLELRLVELGAALAAPDGEELIDRVALDLATPSTELRPSRPSPRVLAVVGVAAVVILAVSIEPSRRAIADLFRVGGVEIRDAREFSRPSSTSVPSELPASTTPHPDAFASQLASAGAAVDFDIRLPNQVPTRTPSISVDRSVPGGLVTLDYGEFRLVEVAAPPDHAILAKGLNPNTRVTPTNVNTASAYWFTGTHHLIAYLDRDGTVRQDTVSNVGHVLVWAADGVTYRIEGLSTLARARQVATSIA